MMLSAEWSDGVISHTATKVKLLKHKPATSTDLQQQQQLYININKDVTPKRRTGCSKWTRWQ